LVSHFPFHFTVWAGALASLVAPIWFGLDSTSLGLWRAELITPRCFHLPAPTHTLKLGRSASEIVELDRDLHDAYPAVSQPALPKVRQPTVRKSDISDRISDGLGTAAVGVSESDTANLTVRDLAEYLTKVSNHPVLREAMSWIHFVYARPNVLESVRAVRAMEVRSDIFATVAAPTSTVNAAMHNSSVSHDTKRTLAMPSPSTSTRLLRSSGRSSMMSSRSSRATISTMQSFHSARTTPWRHLLKFDESAVRVDS
jgi:hypothetical protein